MNILVVSQYYYPEQFLINEILPELVRRGHKVTVVTGLPNYPEGFVPKEYRSRKKRKENIDGVQVIRTYEIGRGNGVFRRILNAASYVISASLQMLRLKEDFNVVLSYQLSPVTCVIPSLVYKRFRHKSVLLYCCDIWPDSVREHIANEKGIPYKFVSRLSRYIYNKVDAVVVSTRLFIDYMRRVNNVPLEKLSYCPQHSGTLILNENLSSKDNGIADFMYAGNLGVYQEIDVIIKAASLLKNRNDFKVHIVGDGSCKEQLVQLVKEEKIEDKVLFYDRVPFSRMVEKYKLADALLITLGGRGEVGKTIPTKLQAYMSTGKPIFGAINGGAEEIITESQCGRLTSAGDYEGLARLMQDYIEHPNKYKNCGNNAREYFKNHFTLKIYVDWLEGELLKLASSKELKS